MTYANISTTIVLWKSGTAAAECRVTPILLASRLLSVQRFNSCFKCCCVLYRFPVFSVSIRPANRAFSFSYALYCFEQINEYKYRHVNNIVAYISAVCVCLGSIHWFAICVQLKWSLINYVLILTFLRAYAAIKTIAI